MRASDEDNRSGTRHDVAVIGAGPSGSWTAYWLARGGARVLLIDPSHPREKPCGGGITGRALELVAAVLDVNTLPTVAVRSARFTASSTSGVADVPLAEHSLFVASRSEFDALLLDAAGRAGARLLESRATEVRSTRQGFEIDTGTGVHRADWLIGADGANSLVRRRLMGPFRRDQLSIATGFFAHGVTSDQISIELVADPPGYIWSFPRPTHLAIGVCAQADAGSGAGALRTSVANWITRAGPFNHARLEPYAWPIPSLSGADLERLQPSGTGWCLVGDAAGLVDPITREGIYFALLSGRWAAEALLSGEKDAPHRYASQVRDEIGLELARAARLKTAFFHPRFTRLMIEALGQSESIARVMADLVAGRQDYAGLKWRLAKTLEVGLAIRLLLSGTGSRRGREPEGSDA